jgi:type IV pilus assembly protein PilB
MVSRRRGRMVNRPRSQRAAGQPESPDSEAPVEPDNRDARLDGSSAATDGEASIPPSVAGNGADAGEAATPDGAHDAPPARKRDVLIPGNRDVLLPADHEVAFPADRAILFPGNRAILLPANRDVILPGQHDVLAPPQLEDAPVSAPEHEAAVGGAPRRGTRLLGEILVESGLTTEDQIATALLEQPAAGKRLGLLLVDEGVLDERDLAGALAAQFGLEVVDLRRTAPEPEAIACLPEAAARELTAIPIRRTERGLDVAIADPLENEIATRISDTAAHRVTLLLATESDIRLAIENSYKATARVGQVVKVYEALAEERVREAQVATPAVVDENAPIVQVVSLVLEQAVRDRASDVHIECVDGRVRVRNRTDGALHEVLSLPVSMAQPLISRIKVMADMNIVERRRPQDGQIEAKVAGRKLDIRVSTTATVFGEKCVLRLLDKTRALFRLGELGMPADTAARFELLARSPYGMVICAGPTGSGKTTTLYATLMEINRDEINVMTIEDPVEYVFPEINQVQINEASGITFATGLRSILRQDPDSILVGEIRDVDTARIAVQSALTGHFVLSSLHATDSTAALHRFLDMGIEPFLVASSLVGVVGQRLVRRICPSCRVPYTPAPDELAFYEHAGGPAVDTLWHGEGCNFCGQTGYFERVGVYEVLQIGDTLKTCIVEGAAQDELRRVAVAEGMRTLVDEGLRLVASGTTTIAEILRTIYVS